MKSKTSLTPKDCLYIDDALTQLCVINTQVNDNKQIVEDKKILNLMEEVNTSFANQFESIKQLLEEAGK